ncbi:MAG: phospholipase D family protein [Deltaproteobacteria bacterium HGW-Deltaproteobacteria-6]|jgi:phosphatidylserine/phosphatidylglycerophosphate/cardiolipin synthase-like enzyme|nr:MAG: phospholipase D family protein [Deltaproteobacteria bacterium HGW-Deltaproteobacteria-6]
MKRRLIFLTVIICLFIPICSSAEPTSAKSISNIDVCFSPGGNCTAAIVKELDAARSEILVQAYSFTSAPIAQALVRAHKRGIIVKVILDKSQDREGYSSVMFLKNAGIPTSIDSAHAIAHNKVMIIDAETVITGSFNFTKAAEQKNAENLLIIKSRDLAKFYIDNWMRHKEHSG